MSSVEKKSEKKKTRLRKNVGKAVAHVKASCLQQSGRQGRHGGLILVGDVALATTNHHFLATQPSDLVIVSLASAIQNWLAAASGCGFRRTSAAR